MTLLLLLAAFGVPAFTVREVRAEFLWGTSRQDDRVAPNSRERQIKLRRALQLDPVNAGVLQALGQSLITVENDKYRRGQYASMSVDNLREGLDLLDRADRIFGSKARVTRYRGEAALMMAYAARRLNRPALAALYHREAFDQLLASARYIPQPFQTPGAFNVDVLRSAQAVGREDAAIESLHAINRMRWRGELERKHLGTGMARSFFNMGMYPRTTEEYFLALDWRPEDGRAVSGLAACAQAPGLHTHVGRLFDLLEQRGKLTAEAAAAAESLRQAAAGPGTLVETGDELPEAAIELTQ
ncbi:hypothetical protein HZA57_02140 [Candidatus Poribacteria bacterium]|nr:hypothetical protein [Candidatus Poribacteria bacterium]